LVRAACKKNGNQSAKVQPENTHNWIFYSGRAFGGAF